MVATHKIDAMNGKALHRQMRVLNAPKAALALCACLKDFRYEAAAQELTAGLNALPAVTWSDVVFWLERLAKRDDYAAITDNISGLDEIMALARVRIGQELKARDRLSDTAFELWQEIAFMNPHTVQSRLKALLNASGSREAQLLFEKLPEKGKSWDSIVRIIRAALTEGSRTENISWARDKEQVFVALEAYEAVLLYLIDDDKTVPEVCAGYRHCALCWRFVPVSSQKERPLCSAHQRNRQEYKHALVLASSREPFWLSDAAAHRERALRPQFRLDASNLPQEWMYLWGNDLQKIYEYIEKPVMYDMKKLGEALPHVFAYVRQDGADPEVPLALIEALGAIENGDLTARRSRKQLHRILAANLMLVRSELCMAEAYLEAYQARFGRYPHT